MKLYDPDETGTHCSEYHPVSGDAPLHDTDTRPHDSNAPTVNTGATGNDTEVVVVVVVVVDVVDVGTIVVVVVVVVDVGTLVALMVRTEIQTLSSTNSGVAIDAELRRNNRACGTLNRAARRDHESFGNTRCVEVHCGEGLTFSADNDSMLEALAAAAPAPSDDTTANIAAVIAMRATRPLDICSPYAISNKQNKSHCAELQPNARMTRRRAVRPVLPRETFSAAS